MLYAMERLLTIRKYPQGPRVWVCGQRVHHGSVGVVLALVTAALRRKRLAVVVLLLILHDRRDWRIWFARERCP